MQAMGYTNVHLFAGGTQAWGAAGFPVYKGVNLPSKTFGELVEHADDTPRVSVTELDAMIKRGDDIIVLDGRTFAEYSKMSIPTGISCPNGELAYRVGEIVKSPKTTIIVNCAGRTRSILGAQTLRNFGVVSRRSQARSWRESQVSAGRCRCRLVRAAGEGTRTRRAARREVRCRGAGEAVDR
jgi:rhodanese-related sulfurtransferase